MEDDLTFDFSFDVTGQIWQIAIDDASGSIAVEIREEEDQKMYFLIFNIQTLEVSDYLAIDQADWWTTLVSVKSQYLFLDKYLDPQDPTKKSLLVFDSASESLMKELEDFQLSHISKEGLVGTKASDRAIEQKFPIPELRIDMKEPVELRNATHPVFYSEGSDSFDLAKTFLDQEIFLGVEYWEGRNHIIISYYIRSGAKFDRKLLVLREEEEYVDLILDKGLEGFASGAFLIISDYLVFIQGSNQINGIKL
ncbi:MAG: DUF4905 domain-containing protein [Cyclobacteriaceae bacterium]